MDRREHYRVEPVEGDDLQVSFAKPGRPPVPGLVLDVSAGGVMVQLALAGCPDLAMGEEVELSFTLDQLQEPLVIPARVAHRTETESSRAYGFRFTNRERLESQLPGKLFRLFNRRASYRVHPDPDTPIAVTLEGVADGMRVQGQLVDISVTGVGVHATVEPESALPPTSRIKLCFSLPNGADSLHIDAIIRRQLASKETRYGIEFILETTKTFQQQQTILDYVMERREAMLLNRKVISPVPVSVAGPPARQPDRI